MIDNRPKKDADTILRGVRHMNAQVNRMLLDEPASLTFESRRKRRLAERAILNSPALYRVASCAEIKDEFHVTHLINLITDHLPYVSQKSLRQLAAQSKKLREDIATTVRMLREFAEMSVNTRRDEVLKVAKDFDDFFIFASTSRASYLPYDELVGQKSGMRAFVTRAIAGCVPADCEKRFATIAELVGFAGYKTTPQLVRSTLLKGST